ncbi:unnamed protein product [Gulo gulo]|uniref:Uncharacterized protein n=1 Tax=Gulo gulo TaxID=48420 RepID=A0A9X9LKR7_GULGU|nr:unnamed protein product [Gulo gulo]
MGGARKGHSTSLPGEATRTDKGQLGSLFLSHMSLVLTNHLRAIRAPGASDRRSQALSRQSWEGEPGPADLKPGFCLLLQAPAAQVLPEQGEPGIPRLQHWYLA